MNNEQDLMHYFSPGTRYDGEKKRQGFTYLWDARGYLLAKLEGHDGGVRAVAFDGSSTCIASGRETRQTYHDDDNINIILALYVLLQMNNVSRDSIVLRNAFLYTSGLLLL